MAELTPNDLEYLTGTSFATFVTVNPDGSPHATVTWVDAADGEILVNTARGRVKHRNCEANPHVALTIMRDGDAYDWISITGRIVGFAVGDRAERHIDELSWRYDGHGYRFTPGQQRVIVKIRPDRIIRYGDGGSGGSRSERERASGSPPED